MLDVDKVEKKKKEYEGKNYEISNSSKNKLWYYTGYFFHFLNILICFFGLYIFLDKIIPPFPLKDITISTVTVIMLLLWEMLKRVILKSTTQSFLKDTALGVKIPNIILSIILIVCSGFVAIHGANEISDKNKSIKKEVGDNFLSEKKVLDSLYNNDKLKYEQQIKFIYDNAKNYKGEQRALNNSEIAQVERIESNLKLLFEKHENDISELKDIKKETITESTEENNNYVLIFLLLTVTFESFIIIGVCYCAIYDYKSTFEIVENKEYKKYEKYKKMLHLYYQDDKLKEDDQCLTDAAFREIIKVKNYTFSNSDITDFYAILKHNNVIAERKGVKGRFFNSNYKEALKIIKKNFEGDYYGVN